jgi:ribosomal protein S18 acetylase RimI-like enzyme
LWCSRIVNKEQLHIEDYKEQYSGDFAALNKAWLEEYFVVEPIDEAIFADPKGFIIEKGGYIFFAKLGDRVVGTFALMKMEERVFELSKMAVAKDFHGRGTGSQLLRFCLDKGRELGAHKIILYSNTSLKSALHLYRKFGFITVPLDSTEYKRANIKMEINLI